MEETVEAAKSTIWYILKKKEGTGELSITERPGRPWKITELNDHRILPLHTVYITKIHPARARILYRSWVYHFKSTHTRDTFYEGKYRAFTTEYKLLVKLMNRKARLDFSREKF